MQFFVLVLALAVTFSACANGTGMENLMGTPVHKCINCLCHAISGCWSRINCARYSISIDYWKKAGSLNNEVLASSEANWKGCMKNENCILNTIKRYTDQYGKKDCNCDGVFDCKDRLALHRFGEHCLNPNFGDTYAERFNHCAESMGVSSMSPVEGDCSSEKF